MNVTVLASILRAFFEGQDFNKANDRGMIETATEMAACLKPFWSGREENW